MTASETDAALVDAALGIAIDTEPDRRRVILARIAVILTFLGLWQLVVAVGLVDAFWISTPALTMMKASRVPIEISSPSTESGTRPATMPPTTPQRTIENCGVLVRGLTRPKRGGSIPSSDIRMKIRVCP